MAGSRYAGHTSARGKVSMSLKPDVLLVHPPHWGTVAAPPTCSHTARYTGPGPQSFTSHRNRMGVKRRITVTTAWRNQWR